MHLHAMNLHVIDTGFFKLDGGAMFGVVPKTLWSKNHPPDEKNLCTWAMRCLLVETGGRLILIDNGIGDKQDARKRADDAGHADRLHRSLPGLPAGAPGKWSDKPITLFRRRNLSCYTDGSFLLEWACSAAGSAHEWHS